MPIRRAPIASSLVRLVGAAAIVAVSVVAHLAAHPFTFKGTVVSAEPTKVTMHFVDPDSKKEKTEAFEIDKDTKIFRGDAVVTFADAKVTKGEAISITVNLDDDEHFADVIRLEARKKQAR